MYSLFLENVKISLNAIRSQLLRTILTILIIAIGLMALVGILTSIDAIKSSINSNFSSMGANSFTIRNREMTMRIGRRGNKPKQYRAISFYEAEQFKNEFNFPAVSSVSTMATGMGTVKFSSNKTNPNIQIFGIDENYLTTSGYEIEKGRNFSKQEIESGTHTILLGKELVTTLFKAKENPLEQVVSIGGGKYKVIGILKSKGSSMGFGGDKICLIPIENARQYFSRPNMSFTINIMTKNALQMEIAISEATGLFRKIRAIRINDDSNFEITKSDSLANILIDNLKKVTMGTTIIGIITLLGAAIGLMNIMLVSVTERTREIGVRKAIGATQSIIKNQFLIESIVICQLGGIVGITLGIIIGNLISFALGIGFIVPWLWIISGIFLCIVVGVVSGIYPAIKASKLDPIEALRVE